jgi:hypothetical protein
MITKWFQKIIDYVVASEGVKQAMTPVNVHKERIEARKDLILSFEGIEILKEDTISSFNGENHRTDLTYVYHPHDHIIITHEVLRSLRWDGGSDTIILTEHEARKLSDYLERQIPAQHQDRPARFPDYESLFDWAQNMVEAWQDFDDDAMRDLVVTFIRNFPGGLQEDYEGDDEEEYEEESDEFTPANSEQEWALSQLRNTEFPPPEVPDFGGNDVVTVTQTMYAERNGRKIAKKERVLKIAQDGGEKIKATWGG